MKLRVAFTRQSNFDIDDLDFLTEALLQEVSSPIRKAKRALNQANDALAKAKTPEEIAAAKDNIKRAEAEYEYARTQVEVDAQIRKEKKANANSKKEKKANANSKKEKKANARSGGSTTGQPTTTTALVRRNPNAVVSVASEKNVNLVDIAKRAASGNTQNAANAFIEMMRRFGNSLARMFRALMDWLRNLPVLGQLIIEPLRGLWQKIKNWCSKLHIVDRAKSLSIAMVSCVGFVGAMIANWSYKILFKTAGNSKWGTSSLDPIKTGFTSITRQALRNAKSPNPVHVGESAVFIEELGEILREDNNGGTLIAIAKNVIGKSTTKATAIWNTFKNSSNKILQNFAGFLNISVNGSNAVVGKNLTAGTRFDDSLPALYESIIREAQAHKIKSIKKKAIKKVAMKKARAKKSLRGQM